MCKFKLGDVVSIDDGRIGVVSKLLIGNMAWVEYDQQSSFCWGVGIERLEKYNGELTQTLKELRNRYREVNHFP